MNLFNLPTLTLSDLKSSVQGFIKEHVLQPIPELYGTTDGKAVGTFVEQIFRRYLAERYSFTPGNSAYGIDLPDLNVDLKATSVRQPQSSCPFRNANQKVYGLGYHLIIFVYDKKDDNTLQTANLDIQHVIFVEKERTADYQTTIKLAELLRNNANQEDIVAFLEDRHFPLDEVGRVELAERILQEHPETGYLTISNALQWRLQYSRVIDVAGRVGGVEKLYV